MANKLELIHESLLEKVITGEYSFEQAADVEDYAAVVYSEGVKDELKDTIDTKVKTARLDAAANKTEEAQKINAILKEVNSGIKKTVREIKVNIEAGETDKAKKQIEDCEVLLDDAEEAISAIDTDIIPVVIDQAKQFVGAAAVFGVLGGLLGKVIPTKGEKKTDIEIGPKDKKVKVSINAVGAGVGAAAAALVVAFNDLKKIASGKQEGKSADEALDKFKNKAKSAIASYRSTLKQLKRAC